MQITCPQCQTQIPAGDVELGRGLAKCAQCNEVFDFTSQIVTTAGDESGTAARVVAPRGARDLTVDDGSAFERRWFGLRHALGGTLGLGMAGFMLLLDSATSFWPLAALPWAAAFAGLGYGVMGALNRTVVTVDAEAVRVNHRPMPWFGRRVFYRGALEGVYVLERVSNTGQSRIVRYEVWVKQTAGRAAKLIGGLHSAHEACYIEDRLKTALGLEEVRVSGAFEPLPGVVPTSAPSDAAGGLGLPVREQGALTEAEHQDVDEETPLG